MQLAAVRIFVRDLSAARDFYQRDLGINLEYDGSAYGFCKFSSGGIEIILEPIDSDAPEDDQALVGRFLGLSFAVQDVDAEYANLSRRGVRFSGSPENQAWGGRLATLMDPSNNQLQLVQYPAVAGSVE